MTNMTSQTSCQSGGPLEGPCVARTEDVPGIVALANQIFRPAPRPGDMGKEFPVLLGTDNAESLHVFRDAGRVVSHVGVLRQMIHTCGLDIPAACIGSVCTDPSYRKAGLASQLMDLAIQRSIEAGDLLMPISGDRPLYLSRGATYIGPQIRFMVPLGTRPSDTGSEFVVSAYEQDNWLELAGLQQSAPVRYEWSDREPRIVEAVRSHGGICLLARRKTGQLAGALLFTVGHPMYNTQPGIGRVIQFWGDIGAIPSLLALIASTNTLKGLDWYVLPAAQPEVARALLEAGATGKASTSSWTVLILNLVNLIEKVGPAIARSGVELTAKGNQLTVAAEGKTICLDRMDQLVEILFRGPAAWSAELAAMPVALRIACSAALPIRLPDYGINFV